MFGKVADQGPHTVRLKIYRLPNFNSMLFQLVLTKFFKSELFSSCDQLMQKADRAFSLT